MSKYWQIPKEWVQDWGLSGNEAILLADILQSDTTTEKRAASVNMTKRNLLRVVDAFRENDKIVSLLGEKMSPKLVKKCHQKGEKMSPKPTKKKSSKPKENKAILPIEQKEKIENAPQKTKTQKYSDEETKFHGDLMRIYLEEYRQSHHEEFYWQPQQMVATIKIAKQIQFFMPESEKENKEKIKHNFQAFIHRIFSCGDRWLFDNATPVIINSKFNEIYSTLKNGNKQPTAQPSGTSGISASYLDRTLREAFGSDYPK